MNKTIKDKFASTKLVRRFLADKHYRNIVFAAGSMGFNLLYGIFNGILGIIYASLWFITMCAYYLTLGCMRLAVVTLDEKNNKRTERSVMCHNGIAMLFLAVVLVGTVTISFLYPVSKSYPVTVMIAIATYTFLIAAFAIRNAVCAHKEHSLITITLRNISLAGVAASMLTLQRSMIATFGSEDADFANTMNGISGLGVFLIVLVLGISMIIQGRERKVDER